MDIYRNEASLHDLERRSDRWIEIEIRFKSTHFASRVKSTLNHEFFASGRRMGNTTRQVNFAIDHIFNGGVIVCEDHHHGGAHVNANKRLHELVMRRLHLEHPWIKNQIKTDSHLLYIYIKEHNATDQKTP
jgi:hypothetical protein